MIHYNREHLFFPFFISKVVDGKKFQVMRKEKFISMRLPGDDGKRSSSHSIFYMVLGVSAFVLILLFTVMKDNRKNDKDK